MTGELRVKHRLMSFKRTVFVEIYARPTFDDRRATNDGLIYTVRTRSSFPRLDLGTRGKRGEEGGRGSKVYLSGGPVSLRMAGFSLAVAEGDGAGGDPSSSSSSSVASPSSSSLATVAQPLSLGLIGPSSSAQSPPSSAWRSAPGPEPSTPSSPATENECELSSIGRHARCLRCESSGMGGRGEDGRLATSRFRSGESREAGDA